MALCVKESQLRKFYLIEFTSRYHQILMTNSGIRRERERDHNLGKKNPTTKHFIIFFPSSLNTSHTPLLLSSEIHLPCFYCRLHLVCPNSPIFLLPHGCLFPKHMWTGIPRGPLSGCSIGEQWGMHSGIGVT